jgi:hypothetical protein
MAEPNTALDKITPEVQLLSVLTAIIYAGDLSYGIDASLDDAQTIIAKVQARCFLNAEVQS